MDEMIYLSGFIVTVNQVRDYIGERLETPRIVYASRDTYAGDCSTGVETFDDNFHHAIYFNSINEINEWIEHYKNRCPNEKKYDFSSMKVRKVILDEVELDKIDVCDVTNSLS